MLLIVTNIVHPQIIFWFKEKKKKIVHYEC